MFFIILLMMLCGCVEALAVPLSFEEADARLGIVRPSGLLKASLIVVGQVNSIIHTNDSTLMRSGNPLAVHVSVASINVLQVLKGEQIEMVQIGKILNSTNSEDDVKLQGLELNKSYVLFLKKSADMEFVPISPYQFAIELEILPQPISSNSATEEVLHHIARDNVAATNSSIAESWGQFLQGLYHKDDLVFWTNRINDNRIAIRTIAIETLVENAPKTPSLYLEVMKLLDGGTVFYNPIVRHHLLELVPKMATTNEPSMVDLESWISKSEEFQKLALGCIQETKNVRLIPDVVYLMTTSKDRDIQYDCIKTLAAITGDIHLISQPNFLKQPDLYIQEWQKAGSNPTKS
jgi:hypothetical protein